MNKFIFRYVFVSAVAVVLVGVSFFAVHLVLGSNFIGPTQNAGLGQGAIGVDSASNLAVGTSTTQSDTKLLIVGTSTNSSYFAIKAVNLNTGPLFIVRSDGSVTIGSNAALTTQNGTATGTISGVSATAPSNGSLYVNGPIFTTLDLKASGLAIGTTTPQSGGNALITGNLTINGTCTGCSSSVNTVNAANVTAGTFGSNGVGGNYAFPSALSVGTSTAPSAGIAFFNGSVGIGTASPVARLQLTSGGNQWTTAGWNRGIEIANANVIKWTEGATYAWGIGQTSDNLYFINSTADNNSAAATYPMVILGNGNVGIGTSTPSAALDVNGRLALEGNQSYVSNGTTQFIGTATEGLQIIPKVGSTYDLSLYNSNGSGVMKVPTATQNAYFLGNVGIGTSTISGALDVNGGATSPTLLLNESSAGPWALILRRTDLGTGSDVDIYNNSGEFAVSGNSTNATGKFFNTNTAGTGDGLLVETNSGGTGSYALEVAPNLSAALYVRNDGNVGIGTTVPSNLLDVAGNINLEADGSHDAVLKVGYTSASPAGYYATYAP